MSKEKKKDNLVRFVEDYLLTNVKLNADEVLKSYHEFLEVIKKEEFEKVNQKLNKKYS